MRIRWIPWQWPAAAGLAWMLVAATVTLLAAGCGGAPSDAVATPGSATGTPDEPAKPEEPAIAVKVEPVGRASLSAVYSTSTTLRSDKRATVTARTSGVIREILVEEGDDVAANQKLAVLDDREQRIAHDKATAAYGTLQREFDRAARLHDQGLLSEEDFERIRRDHEDARQTAAMTELVLARTEVRAPFRGRVLLRYLDVGATVGDGTALYDLADLEPLYTDVNVPERHVARVSPGQRVDVIADATGLQTTAQVERIAPFVDTTTGTVKVTLAVRGGRGLKPGSFVRVQIATDTHENALVVPRSALVAEGRRWYLYRVAEGGERAQRLEIERGYEERDRVEVLRVLDGGDTLLEGEQVVVRGASALSEDSRITVLTNDDAADDDDPNDDGASDAGAAPTAAVPGDPIRGIA